MTNAEAQAEDAPTCSGWSVRDVIKHEDVVVAHSVTQHVDNGGGAVLVTGSHGGRYAAERVVQDGYRAAVFNDAGVGLNQAGVAGVYWLDEHAVPAVAVSHLSAAIGNGCATLDSGVVSHVNTHAWKLGCRPGMTTRNALKSLVRAPIGRPHQVIASASRRIVKRSGLEIAILDSAAMIDDSDRDRAVVTGSHGALLGGDPRTAVKAMVGAAVFNDAGGGPDRRGATRLPVLDELGIPGMLVDCFSARIGDGASSYTTGVLSSVNTTATRLGIVAGMSVKVALKRLGEFPVRDGQ